MQLEDAICASMAAKVVGTGQKNALAACNADDGLWRCRKRYDY